MTSSLTRNILLGLVAFSAGLLLQCMSDPEVTGDGGVVDQFLVDLGVKDKPSSPDKVTPDRAVLADMLKDGIGKKADAAQDSGTTGTKVKEWNGKLLSKDQTIMCGLSKFPRYHRWTEITNKKGVWTGVAGGCNFIPSTGCLIVPGVPGGPWPYSVKVILYL